MMTKLMLDIRIEEPAAKINYQDGILLIGSCFTEHIGNALMELKFDALQNPNGILFDPSSVASALISYIENGKASEADLFELNETWQSWQHHGRFAATRKDEVLSAINQARDAAHRQLKKAKWLIITLGTSFSYRLADKNMPVANCHRAPQNWFHKHLMSTEETIIALDNALYRLFQFNPQLRVMFTVSPVRHVRDGVVENNRSKARLLEAVHHLVGKFDRLYYFPAYELVIDVLRDYRFYDIDLVHPNYQATSFVIEEFMEHCVDKNAVLLSKEVQQLVTARKHKPFQPSTEAHRKFLRSHAEKTRSLMNAYPFLKLQEELAFFEAS